MATKLSFDLEGKVVLITGSSTGLGKAMAFALGRAGAKVALNYANNDARAAKTFAEFRAEGLQGALYKASVIDEHQVHDMVQSISRDLGGVDIVVVNATCDQPHMRIEDFSLQYYKSMLDFFLISPFLLTRAVLPHMKEQRWGRIINIGSEVVARAVPNFVPYVAAKSGQNGFTRSMATELAPWNITVNMISPGWIPVERHVDEVVTDGPGYRVLIPLDRWGVPEDVSGTAIYLASQASSFVTGQNIHVNGGMTTQGC
ncbi:MAG: SDR family oxidoreductase [Planctomycetota bacterium]|nr:MAG: SDR family oxidoreductase [Planctomycetota bacterium]